jgi:hypothetical protein
VRSRAERFDDLVLDAVERLEKQWAAELADVEFAVEDVPPAEPGPGATRSRSARCCRDGARAAASAGGALPLADRRPRT